MSLCVCIDFQDPDQIHNHSSSYLVIPPAKSDALQNKLSVL